jgi:hypothetical protein
MKGNVINIDKQQIELINLIDEWLRDEMVEPTTTKAQLNVIYNAREFLTKILEKGWYREGGDDQLLLIELRSEWIRNGGKWRS